MCPDYEWQKSIEKELSIYNELLKEHIRRTNMLETYVKDQSHVWETSLKALQTSTKSNQAFTIKLLSGLGGFLTLAIPLMIQLLASIK